jgi:hypothetical protein
MQAINDWGSAMMTSLAAALAMFLSAIPKIIGFAVILVVAWLLSSLVEKGLSALLRKVRFDELADRSGFGDFVAKMNVGTDAAGMLGLVAKWFIRLIGLVVAFDALGLPAVSDVLRDFLLWMPNLIVALVVLVIGGLAARALSNLVRGATAEAGITNSNFLAKLASVMVWAFAIVVAVNQIGIATTLVNTLFMAFVGAIALGLGLAFGLGGRETASKIVSQMYDAAKDKGPQLAHAGEAAGRMARERTEDMRERAQDTMQTARSSGGSGGSSGGNQGGMGGAPGMAGGGYGGSNMGGGMGGGSAGGGYTGGGGGSTGGGYTGGGGGVASGGPQYPTDGGPRTTPGTGASQDMDDLYATPSAPRGRNEG